MLSTYRTPPSSGEGWGCEPRALPHDRTLKADHAKFGNARFRKTASTAALNHDIYNQFYSQTLKAIFQELYGQGRHTVEHSKIGNG
jgi:hypothetical protein